MPRKNSHIDRKQNMFDGVFKRFYSSNSSAPSRDLTHVNKKGEAHMVSIHEKPITHRTATAKGTIKFSNSNAISLIQTNNNKKGDVVSVSRIAGIMAVKQTSQLIPLCHPISITKINVDIQIKDADGLNCIDVYCTVACDGKTGVEMEALVGVNICLLTIYDMCKAVDKFMILEDCKVVSKAGGQNGDFKILEVRKE